MSQSSKDVEKNLQKEPVIQSLDDDEASSSFREGDLEARGMGKKDEKRVATIAAALHHSQTVASEERELKQEQEYLKAKKLEAERAHEESLKKPIFQLEESHGSEQKEREDKRIVQEIKPQKPWAYSKKRHAKKIVRNYLGGSIHEDNFSYATVKLTQYQKNYDNVYMEPESHLFCEEVTKFARDLNRGKYSNDVTVEILPFRKEEHEQFFKILSEEGCYREFRLIINSSYNIFQAPPSVDELTTDHYPLHIGIDLYVGQEKSGWFIEQFARLLSSGPCHPGLRLTLDFKAIDGKNAEMLAQVLESGNCSRGLKITCGNISNEALIRISQALRSGKCPKEITFEINNGSLNAEARKHLIETLSSDNCPEDFTYFNKKILFEKDNPVDSILDEQCQLNALKTGKTPAGLTLEVLRLFGKPNKNIADELFQTLSSGQCREGLTLHIWSTMIIDESGKKLGSKYFFQGIAKAIKTGKCPKGFGLVFDSTILYEDARILGEAINHPNCPEGMRLTFLKTDRMLLQPLLQAMTYSNALTTLHLNHVDDGLARLVLDATNVNPTLITIEIDHYTWEAEWNLKLKEAIEQALIKNQQNYLREQMEVVKPSDLGNIVLGYLDFTSLRFDTRTEALDALAKGEYSRFYRIIRRLDILSTTIPSASFRSDLNKHWQEILKLTPVSSIQSFLVDDDNHFILAIKIRDNEPVKYFEITRLQGLVKVSEISKPILETIFEDNSYLTFIDIANESKATSFTTLKRASTSTTSSFYSSCSPLHNNFLDDNFIPLSASPSDSKANSKQIIAKRYPASDSKESKKINARINIQAEPKYGFDFIILGNQDVGKTHLLENFHGAKANNTERLRRNLNCEGTVIQVSTFNFQVRDHYWRDRDRPDIRKVRRMDGVIIAFDTTDISSFNSINYWLSEQELSRFDDAPRILVGTKADLSSEREIPFHVAAKRAQKLGMHYIEVSSITGINVDEVFLTLTAEILKLKMAEETEASQSLMASSYRTTS